MWLTQALETRTDETLISLLGIQLLIAIPVFCFLNKTGQRIDSLFRALFGFIVGAFIFYILAIIFGAPIIESIQKTFLWSALMSALVIVPASCTIGIDPDEWRRLFLSAAHVLHPQSIIWVNRREHWCFVVGVSTMVGGWLGAVPIPLDWDRPWQVWPISCTYGALAGYIIGCIVATFMTFAPWAKDGDHVHTD